MSSEQILIPDIGDFDSVDVIEVLVNIGDSIEYDMPLITVESDKASMDIPAPKDGVIKDIKIKVGERHVSLSTWRLLLLVGFISSLLNSFGHNYILSGELLPEHTFLTLATFVIGDTAGTVFCFATLIILFRYFGRSDGEV